MRSVLSWMGKCGGLLFLPIITCPLFPVHTTIVSCQGVKVLVDRVWACVATCGLPCGCVLLHALFPSTPCLPRRVAVFEATNSTAAEMSRCLEMSTDEHMFCCSTVLHRCLASLPNMTANAFNNIVERVIP